MPDHKVDVWLAILFIILITTAISRPIHAAETPDHALFSETMSRRQQETKPVFALPGVLREANGQPFDTYLVGRDGATYALVGQDATVEIQIADLRDQGPDVQVKVWGTLYPQGRLSPVPEIVASSIQSASPAPGNGGEEEAIVIVRAGVINVRTAPDVNAPPVGQLEGGQRCPIIQGSADGQWWQVRCADGLTGWVSAQLVDVMGDPGQAPVAAPTPPPAPTPTPPVFVNWKTAYFANRDLSGEPVALLDSAKVNFRWRMGSPLPQVPVDNFSARFERTVDFPAATYRFVVRSDDGVRVWLRNELIIDAWREGASGELRADRYVSGPASLRIEYFEATGNAEIQFGYAPIREGDWEANYFDNRTLSGESAWIRIEPRDSAYPLDRDWGEGSPNPDRMGKDNWSARWTGTFFFQPGAYNFRIHSDDGVRVMVDGYRVIDLWTGGYKERSSAAYSLGEGYHDIVVEFYEDAGIALVRLWWQRDVGVRDQ
jgi:hypothetical protein